MTSKQLQRELVRHEVHLLRQARKFCRNDAEAHDLVQDTFERAFRGIDGFKPGTNARAWLATILTRLFIDRVRRARIIQLVEFQPDDLAAEPELHVSPEQVLAAIAQLDNDLRQVIELHDLEGLRYREVAEQIGVPTSTVGTRLMRARAQLRQLLETAMGGGR
jgi:RNA polymerase sigma-70 factor (ECF subfamily)